MKRYGASLEPPWSPGPPANVFHARASSDMQNSVVFLGNQPVSVWPKGQEIRVLDHPLIMATRFADFELYHPRLIGKILEMERRPRVRKQYFRGACGTKVHHVDRWNFSEANLIHARALELFRRALKRNEAVADLSWANVYRDGEYCMPHSHLRAMASVVYFVETGDTDPDDPSGGRFCFVDPRLPNCCKEEQDKMTTPYFPGTPAGVMLIFPGQLVHSVNPYSGTQPRITMSWNINDAAVPSSPLPTED